MVIPPTQPDPIRNPDPGPVPPMPTSPRPPAEPLPNPTPDDPGENPDLPPPPGSPPEGPPPAAIGMEEVETDLAMRVLAPLYRDLRDWRAEVQRLFDRTKAARTADTVDIATFEAVEMAKEGLDMQIDIFDDLATGLGAEQPAVAGQLDELGSAFQKLRLATDKIDQVLRAVAREDGEGTASN